MRRRVIWPLIAVAGGALHAQAPVAAGSPPVPTSVPRLQHALDPADSGFARWRHIPVTRHDDTPAAWTLRAGDWDFLIATPRAMDAMDTSEVVERTLESCRLPLNVSERDMEHVAAAHPWAAFDSLMDDRPALVISIMPALHNTSECGFTNLGRPAMISRGVRFVTNYVYDISRDPQSAVLLSRLRVVRPVMLARAPVIVMSRNLMSSSATDQLRLYIPYDAIAPGATGDMPETELQIWSKAGGPPSRIPLPGSIVRAMWWDYLRWRGARLARRAPEDAESARVALERLADPNLAVNDRRAALFSLARTFQASGDAPAAALAANELTRIDPCALSGSGARGGAPVAANVYAAARDADALLDRTRPVARCTSFAPGATLLRGVLIPGYGQYRTWSRAVGAATAVLTVAGAITAVQFVNSANSSYAKYKAAQNGFAASYRASAQRDRADARTVATITAGVWLATAIEAEIQERVHAARLAAERGFWIRAVVPASARDGSGAGLAAGFNVRFR
ncbi:MAG: hypothetical protein ACREN6_07500 [Gemmatimonadaceae bacterium]